MKQAWKGFFRLMACYLPAAIQNYIIMKNSIIIFGIALLIFLVMGFSAGTKVHHAQVSPEIVKDTTEVVIAKEPETKLTHYKNGIATYYADKFNGRKTSSGERFNNSGYTAAHMKLPFGTMLRVTNEANGKFVDVKVNDRGPFSKKLEIDLTKKAFMEIASNKKSGTFKVKIEIIEAQS